ncbi:CubicO group peptidase, beta-lactamase class C family [Sphingomonas guangdongensis]|uniref:CubicO group peptidase, beta-lactamase class C family n=1 Tax=Sphingomonas guangdongensis TaxID=1141890 RepID=A0A285QHH1_9SPHN|nr:serine hydrolase domain-containing protein [Sphingomonas guangdongensis]SOB80958.1 CubicO group peptidase, beta-lactamase class C family [Sphingomonas guangdongensis]
MRVKLVTAALLMIGSTMAAHAWEPQAAPQPRPALPGPSATSLQSLFDSYVAQKKMPGIVAAIGRGDAEPVITTAGRIAAEPTAAAANADSLWRIYSMTKPITAMAAMALIEDGKLRLDQPVSDFIPAFRTMRVAVNPEASLESVPAVRPITIRNLLTHTSGLSYNIIAKGALLKEYERLGLIPAAVSAATEPQIRAARPATLAAFAERAAQAPLIAQPGTAWNYSISLDVLGRVIEVASGMPFDRFVQTRLLDPLGMRSTYWTVPGSEVKRFATNYAFVGDAMVPLDPAAGSAWLTPPSFFYGGAGLVSSARDYDRFLRMLLNGGTLAGRRVLKAETVRLAMSNLLPAGVSFGGVGAGTGGDRNAVPMGYGAGGSVYLADAPGGASKGTYGWGGAAGTIAWVDPVRRIRGTVMVNYFPGEKWPVRADVVRALYADARSR